MLREITELGQIDKVSEKLKQNLKPDHSLSKAHVSSSIAGNNIFKQRY